MTTSVPTLSPRYPMILKYHLRNLNESILVDAELCYLRYSQCIASEATNNHERMKNSNTPIRYTTTAIRMHWLVALLIFVAFGMGWYMTGIPGLTPQKLKLFSWHKWLGVTVFGLAVIRVAWRLLHPAPPLPMGIPRWQQKAAHLVHQLLYVLIIAIPLTGYFYSAASGIPVVYLGLFKMPMLIEKNDQLKSILGPTHVWLNYLMATIVLAHVLAALKHQLIDRDGTLSRMLPFLK